jgi:YD repeat-containing protein
LHGWCGRVWRADNCAFIGQNRQQAHSVGEDTAEAQLKVGGTTSLWNEENQLTQVKLTNGKVVNYKYDGLGRRIQRTAAGADERYVYDGADVLLDLNANSSVATTYLNGPGIDNHLRQTSATTGVSYYLTDHLGTTAAIACARAARTVAEGIVS